MNVYRNLLLAAAANIARYRVRSFVVLACLVAICGPYLTGIAISEGVRADADLSVQAGADLYLTYDQFGRNGPVPLKFLPEFRKSPDVTKVIPRVVGRATAMVAVPEAKTIEPELVVILGLEPEQIGSSPLLGDGSALPTFHDGDILIGSALANRFRLSNGQRIRLTVGDVVMPFRIVGVMPSDATIWSAQLVTMTLADAGRLFALPGYASDFLIYCRPGPGNIQAVRQDALQILGDVPYRLQAKTTDVAGYVDKGFRQQQGVFTLLFLVAFAVGIPALLVASGVGLADRNREIGICKAIGWQTSDILTMVTFEQALLSTIAACLATLLSFIWVRVLNGWIVAQFFIGELGAVPPFRLPAQFTPALVGLALLLCLSITLVGGLFATWRLATRLPAESIR